MRNKTTRSKTKHGIQKTCIYVVLTILAMFVLIPLAAVILNSFKDLRESAIITLDLPTIWHPENYLTVIKDGNIVRAMSNGLLVSLITVLVVVTTTSLAAYIVARRECTATRLALIYILIGMMAPIAIIPEIKIMQMLGLQGTRWAIIMVHITANIPFCVFIYSGFIAGVPKELDESAIIDGCGPFRLFYQIIFPLLKPVTFTAVIMTFMNSWNDFQYSLYFITKPEMYTMPQTVYAFKGHYTESLNLLCGDMVLTMIPVLIVYLIAQKYIIAGMTSGAVKG